MKSVDYIKAAIRQFRRNLLRSMLTGLGIVIGIAAVIIVISAGQGMKGFILGQFNQFGTNILQTETRVPSTGSIESGESTMAQATGTVITTLTLNDMMAIREIPNIRTNYAAQFGQDIAVAPNGSKKTVNIFGTSATMMEIDTAELSIGRFYTEEDDAGLARVVVLGSNVARDLFEDADPVGQKIKLKQRNFEVIGVFKPRGFVFMDYDSFVYMPIKTLQKQVLGIDYINFILSQYEDKDKMPETIADVEALMRERHNIDPTDPDKDDFIVSSSQDIEDILDTVLGGFTILLIALAVISLIVGGVGIMNIMFVSVLERTFEIGLRKALGAKRDQILKQFLTEAVIITGIGGISGIITGVVVSFLISLGAASQGFIWPFIVPLYGVILAVGFSTICGLVFGIYPARRAANLDPIEALRYE
ncbi:MAG: ABC transporter permease [Patescibacteria group bacterium]